MTNTPDAIVRVSDARAAERAKAQQDRIIRLHDAVGKQWTKLAAELHDFKHHQRWKELGFKSFDSWMKSMGFGKSRSTLYHALRIGSALAEIPRAELEQIPKANATLLAKVPESKRGALITRAQQMTEERFAAEPEVRAANEGELMLRRTMMLPASLAAKYDYALRVAGWVEDSEVTEVRVEAVITGYLSSQWESELAVVGQSVEDAYRANVEEN